MFKTTYHLVESKLIRRIFFKLFIAFVVVFNRVCANWDVHVGSDFSAQAMKYCAVLVKKKCVWISFSFFNRMFDRCNLIANECDDHAVFKEISLFTHSKCEKSWRKKSTRFWRIPERDGSIQLEGNLFAAFRQRCDVITNVERILY